MKRVFLTFAIVLTSLIGFAQSSASLYFTLDKVKQGDRFTISINMQNTSNITSYSFYLGLPEGFSIVEEYDEEEEEDLLLIKFSRNKSKHNTDIQTTATGETMISAYHNSSVFSGTDGEIVGVTVQCNADVAPGNYNIAISHISFADTDFKSIEQEAFNIPFCVYAEFAVNATSANADMGAVAMPNGGDAVASGTSLTATATPNPGYSFVNWTAGEEVVSTENPYSFSAAKNLALVANFKANKYDVTFAYDNGTENTVTSSDFATVIPTPANPTKTGYTFTGWDPEFVEGATVPVDGVTYTAQWQINQYTITFDADGGSAVDAITQDYASAVTAPAAPTKTGYTFAGWDKAVPSTMPAENTNIMALWTINRYILTYKVDGEVYKQFETEYNAAITPEDAPMKDGYTFSGWSEIPSTMPDSDVEVIGAFACNVELKITDAMWATFVAPFETTMPVGVTAYIVDGVENDNATLILTECKDGIVPAFQPVVINGKPLIHAYAAKEESRATQPVGILDFASSDEYANIGDYVLQNHDGAVGFYCVMKENMVVLPKWKCFIPADNLNTEPGNSVKAFYFDAATAIRKLTTADDMRVFDMNGRQISKLKKGINIVNGVKVLVR